MHKQIQNFRAIYGDDVTWLTPDQFWNFYLISICGTDVKLYYSCVQLILTKSSRKYSKHIIPVCNTFNFQQSSTKGRECDSCIFQEGSRGWREAESDICFLSTCNSGSSRNITSVHYQFAKDPWTNSNCLCNMGLKWFITKIFISIYLFIYLLLTV